MMIDDINISINLLNYVYYFENIVKILNVLNFIFNVV